jgi:hypothetical protein
MASSGKMCVDSGTPIAMHLELTSLIFWWCFLSVFFPLIPACEAEKRKTGFQNNLVTLVALYASGELRRCEQEMVRLQQFYPIQDQLFQLLSLHQLVGLTAFHLLGYLPWPKQS